MPQYLSQAKLKFSQHFIPEYFELMNLRVATYVWPPEINKCALQANLTNVCKNPGFAFEVVHFILQGLHLPFTLTEIPAIETSSLQGTLVYSSERAIANYEADIVPVNDIMNEQYVYLNISYLPQPFFVDSISALINTRSKLVQGHLFTAFTSEVALLSGITYLLCCCTFIAIKSASLVDIYRLSFDQKNFKIFWTTASSKAFIISWATFTSLFLKYYRSQILRHLVVEPAPILPPLRVNVPNYMELLQNGPYKIAVGRYEDDMAYMRLLLPTLATRIETEIGSLVVEVASSKTYVERNPGHFTFMPETTSLRSSHYNDGICSYLVEDAPLLFHSVPISAFLGTKIQETAAEAGYSLAEFGIANCIQQKYYRKYPPKMECGRVAHRSRHWRPLKLWILRPLMVVACSCYVVSIVVLFIEMICST